MPLSWNEIRARAITFSKEFENETSEDAEAKTFWDSFFSVFGITRRRIANFERPVTKSDGKGGFIDLLWRGTLLVEHKSRGKNLDRAYHQATDYFSGLKERDLPRFVLVSDFSTFRLYDLDEDKQHEFSLKDLHKNIKLFAFIAGYQQHSFDELEVAANIKAAEQLGKLHDQLKAIGYTDHPLEVLLVRILFCLFADDTGIFERNQFRDYLERRTLEDGSDLGMHLGQLFQILNTNQPKRLKNLDEQLAAFAYVNGRLFEETLPIAAFDSGMRETLLDACALDWSKTSPAIFGSLFQSIMDKEARRNLGAHYTRESNILKALRPLFLDALTVELEGLTSSKRLLEFQKRLAAIRILDPACGCGNFLVIAYRELRRLELEVLNKLYKTGQANRVFDVKDLVFVDVDQFYGIEVEEFPAQIAQVALWLTDHQMNLQVSETFGQYFARLPLTKSANITHANALRTDWASILKVSELTYIVGNPPFIGHTWQSETQKQDQTQIMGAMQAYGVLDYVCNWYVKAVDLIAQNPSIHCAFVSTNSITQGEQVGLLWPSLLRRGVRINFGHRTFVWTSEARGKAAVHCVIIGFGLQDRPEKWLFEYEPHSAEPLRTKAKNINPYLVDAPDCILATRSEPISDVPKMSWGNKPTDGGHFILSPDEREDLLRKEPGAAKYVRRFMSGGDFVQGIERYCLWLVNIDASELRSMPLVMARVEGVRKSRLESKAESTRAYAAFPTKFRQIAQPDSDYLAIPEVSSERRPYIPIAFVSKDVICSNKIQFVPSATNFHFGVLCSVMHMSWVRAVCGRLKSDYSYSNTIVYNNFPWPDANEKQRDFVSEAAKDVLSARALYQKSTLADLYDPVAMPPELARAHIALDKAVDTAYGKRDFKTEAERVAFLFGLYEKLTSPLALAGGGAITIPKKQRQNKKGSKKVG
jgi:N-6 DNA Methylase